MDTPLIISSLGAMFAGASALAASYALIQNQRIQQRLRDDYVRNKKREIVCMAIDDCLQQLKYLHHHFLMKLQSEQIHFQEITTPREINYHIDVLFNLNINLIVSLNNCEYGKLHELPNSAKSSVKSYIERYCFDYKRSLTNNLPTKPEMLTESYFREADNAYHKLTRYYNHLTITVLTADH